ncbi:MAG TPA: hypothetical protein VLE27_12405 [Thermoanaerobaculia bacterium]|nr:hypothetical protein [Thermoanaerobaculia bacterium]
MSKARKLLFSLTLLGLAVTGLNWGARPAQAADCVTPCEGGFNICIRMGVYTYEQCDAARENCYLNCNP